MMVQSSTSSFICVSFNSPFEELMLKTDTSLISLCPSPKTQQVVCYKNSLIRSHLSTYAITDDSKGARSTHVSVAVFRELHDKLFLAGRNVLL